MFYKICAMVRTVETEETLKKQLANLGIRDPDQPDPYGHFRSPAEALAAEGKTHLISLLRNSGANPAWITTGCIASKNHSLVEDYCKNSSINPTLLAAFYALDKHYNYVEQYIQKYRADPYVVAAVYALNGDYSKIPSSLEKNKLFNYLANAFALAADPSKVPIRWRLHTLLQLLGVVKQTDAWPLEQRDNYIPWSTTSFHIQLIANALDDCDTLETLVDTISNPKSHLYHSIRFREILGVDYLRTLRSSNPVFDNIYQITRHAHGFEELKLIFGDFYLDVVSPDFILPITPAGQLAAEGLNPQAEALRRLGANPDYIVMGLAYSGFHDEVKRYKKDYKVFNRHIVTGYIAANNEEKVAEYAQLDESKILKKTMLRIYAMVGNEAKMAEYSAFVDDYQITIAEGLALAKKSEQLEPLESKNHELINRLAAAHALRSNHAEVQRLQLIYGADPNVIFKHYLRAGNLTKAGEYLERYRLNYNEVACSFASLQMHKQVFACLGRYPIDPNRLIPYYLRPELQGYLDRLTKEFKADVNLIAYYFAYQQFYTQSELYKIDPKADIRSIIQGFVDSGNHDAVEHYRITCNLSYTLILAAYTKSDTTIPKLYKTMIWLGNQGETGPAIKMQLEQLHNSPAQSYHWNGLTGKERVDRILKALDSIETSEELDCAYSDTNSELYQALFPGYGTAVTSTLAHYSQAVYRSIYAFFGTGTTESHAIREEQVKYGKYN